MTSLRQGIEDLITANTITLNKLTLSQLMTKIMYLIEEDKHGKS